MRPGCGNTAGAQSQPHALPLQGGVCVKQAVQRVWRPVHTHVHELGAWTLGLLFVVLKGFRSSPPDSELYSRGLLLPKK